MHSILDGVARFVAPGKEVAIAFNRVEEYYRYLCPFSPDDDHGGSRGLHLRVGYPHIVLRGNALWVLEDILAHELTHAGLHHLSMPLWLEEGLAQMFRHDMTGRGQSTPTAETAARHNRYWKKHGLDEFWRGRGFLLPGKARGLNYQLAEVLARLLVEESRPRWFGLVRDTPDRFLAFLEMAKDADCGELACQQCFGMSLSKLAATFLGEGNWSPTP